MAAADDSLKHTPEHGVQSSPSTSATGVQTPEAPPIPLPPLPQPAPADPARFLRWVKRFDTVLVAVVLVFAFLAASFPVMNSDFFLNAAAGRLIAQGQYEFGKDPFTFTAEGAYWVNHSWLFGLLFYTIYSIGGPVVVVVKALIAALLAWLMIQVGRRAGQSLWIPAACAALGILALSPRLYMQPHLFSFLFLGLTLYLLRRPRQSRETTASGKDTAPARNPFLAYWLIPVVCAFWVNFDSWFILGPITVGLYLLGEILQDQLAPAKAGPDSFAPGEQKALTLAFLASIAACLLNPHHVHALTLPYQLGLTGVTEELADDILFRGMFLGPFSYGYYSHPGIGLSVAGLAVFPLMVLGIASFVCAIGQWRWWRAVLWLAFAALCTYHVRAVPYFAMVAAPITALNFLDFAARRAGVGGIPEGISRRWALLGRFATILLGLVLVAGTVPGWLQSQPYETWRLGWRVEPNPGLVHATESIKQLQDEGKLPKGTVWFNTRPEVANYFAWYLPGERVFLDQRLPLYDKNAAADFVAVRKSLSPEEVGEDVQAWRKVFRDRGVKYLAHYDSNPGQGGRQLVTWINLLGPFREWAPLVLNGRVGVFGWIDPEEKQDPYENVRLDFERLAFGPSVPETSKAPRERPIRAPEPREWWTALWKSDPPRPLETDEAWLYATHFGAQGQTWSLRNRLYPAAVQAAAASALAAGPGGPVVNGALYQTRFLYAYAQGPGQNQAGFNAFAFRAMSLLPFKDAGPPSSLYLAVRAARRALAANPNDAFAHFRLGQSYLSLHNRTLEGSLTGLVEGRPARMNPNIYLLWSGQADPAVGPLQPHIHLMRLIQAAAALHNATQLNPDLELSYFQQANLYDQLGYLESELRVCKEYLRCLLNSTPSSETAERIAFIDKQVKELEKRVNLARDQYEINTANKNVIRKAEYAFQNGLTDTALKVLLEAPAEDLYETVENTRVATGYRLEYLLMVTMGRIEEIRETLLAIKPEEKMIMGTFLGMPAIDWFLLQIATGSGDYKTADELLQQVQEFEASDKSLTLSLLQWDVVPNTPKQLEKTHDLSSWTAMMIGHALLAEAPAAAGMPFQYQRQMFLPLQLANHPRISSDRHPLPYSWIYMLQDTVMTTMSYTQPKADNLLLRAALALESGETEAAKKHLRAIVEMTGGRKGEGVLANLRARAVANMWLGWLEAYPDQ